ncbi:trypsin-like serine protease [Clavibacter capsici]|uniref:Trypsin-like serine protease n=1 Tax=Clavibacter capsici TaxID=1874630 RepID=A0AAE6XSV7_9MICO|nr:trypsin-like serine protease [Clavibacter capsici]QIS42701.1 trypsin-like serine protease [Clavibacter capsici]QIS45647.1 trypsin-like serine protease [Clavibacter capsici]
MRIPHRERPARSGASRRRPVRSRLLALVAALAAVVALGAVGTAPANAEPGDRFTLPVIAGSKIDSSNGTCTVGAVFVARRWYLMLTPYQRATRYILTAAHCGPMYSTVHVGAAAIGTVDWISPHRSDIELIRVSPQPDERTLYCRSHHSSPAFCSPIQTYTPRANGQVFMPSRGRVGRQPIQGTAEPTGRFCTSGFVSGVRCTYHPVSLPRGVQTRWRHVSAGETDEHDAFAGGDSGAPVVSYGHQLLGIVSGKTENNQYLLYTSIDQVLAELPAYVLAPPS